MSNDIPAANFHITQLCNLKCSFCYAHFADTQKKDQLAIENALKIISQLREIGCQKINFAGGEPFLHPSLGELLRHANEIGLKTSIVTNGTLISERWLETYGVFLHWIGLSCDSADEAIQKQLGRGNGSHVAITKRAFQLIRNFNQSSSHTIRTKLNSVITRLNWQEEMGDFVEECAVERWKILQILLIQGENDASYDQLSIIPQQFISFVRRHQPLEKKGVVLVPEDNDAMTNSYVMIDPQGRFYQNRNNRYVQSDFIWQIGMEKALEQVGFSKEKFLDRGGLYDY